MGVDIGGAFLVGLTAFFSPCILPVIPVFISTLIGGVAQQGRTLQIGRFKISAAPVLRVSAFALGVAVTFAILGLAFGALGQVINSFGFMLACSIIVILFGVYQTGIVEFSFLMREKRLALKPREGILGAFLLGFTYSFGWTPCVGLSLGSLLLYVTPQGILLAGLTLLAYSLGFIIPFFVIAVFSDALMSKMKGLHKHTRLIKMVGGLIIVAMGIYMLVNTLTANYW